jgi:mRNA degradation ribonuclease J1/J2
MWATKLLSMLPYSVLLAVQAICARPIVNSKGVVIVCVTVEGNLMSRVVRMAGSTRSRLSVRPGHFVTIMSSLIFVGAVGYQVTDLEAWTRRSARCPW